MRESEISEPWWVATGLLLKQAGAPEAVARRRPHGAFGRRCSPGVCFSEVTEDTLAQNWRTVCRLSRESLCSVTLAQSAGHPEPQVWEGSIAMGRQPGRLPKTTRHPQSACGCHLPTSVRGKQQVTFYQEEIPSCLWPQSFPQSLFGSWDSHTGP